MNQPDTVTKATLADVVYFLTANNVFARIRAVRLLRELPADQAVSLASKILDRGDNLGMRLEVIRILPELVTPSTEAEVCAIIERSIVNKDVEVARCALLISCTLRDRLRDRLVSAVRLSLLAPDTDLQYTGIQVAKKMRSKLARSCFVARIKELATKSDNRVIQAEATALLTLMEDPT